MTYKGNMINDLVATVEEKQPLMGVGFNMRPSDYDKLRGAKFFPPYDPPARVWQAAKMRPTQFGDKKNKPRRVTSELNIDANGCVEVHTQAEGGRDTTAK